MNCSMPGLPVPHHLLKFLKFMSIASVMSFSYLILWHPLLLLRSIFPSIRDFSMSQLFASDEQNPGVSTSASVLPVSIQGWFPLRLTGLKSLQSKGLSGVFSSTIVQRHPFFSALPSLQALTNVRDHWEDHSLDCTDFVGRVMSPLFNIPAKKQTSDFMSPTVVILEHKKRKIFTISTFSPSICHEVMGLDAVILILVLSQLFHSLPSSSSRGSLVPLHFLPLEWYHLLIWSCDISPENLDSSLWFTQPGLSHYVLSIEVKMSRVTICSLDMLLSQFWTSVPCKFLSPCSHFLSVRASFGLKWVL